MATPNYYCIGTTGDGWVNAIEGDADTYTPVKVYDDTIWFPGEAITGTQVIPAGASTQVANNPPGGVTELMLVDLDGAYNPAEYWRVIPQLEAAIALLTAEYPENPVAVKGWGPLHSMVVDYGGFTSLNFKEILYRWHDPGEEYVDPELEYDPLLCQKHDALLELSKIYVDALTPLVDFLVADHIPLDTSGSDSGLTMTNHKRHISQLAMWLYCVSDMPVLAYTNTTAEDATLLGYTSGTSRQQTELLGERFGKMREAGMIAGLLFPVNVSTTRPPRFCEFYKAQLT